jgi:hypothetical protein
LKRLATWLALATSVAACTSHGHVARTAPVPTTVSSPSATPSTCPSDTPEEPLAEEYCLAHSDVEGFWRIDVVPPPQPVIPGKAFEVVVVSDCGLLSASLQLAWQNGSPVTQVLRLTPVHPPRRGWSYQFRARGVLPSGTERDGARVEASTACGPIEATGNSTIDLPVDER